MADADCRNVLRQEFHTFWQSGLQEIDQDYLQDSAIVCFLDLDHEETNLTRVFSRAPEDSADQRAEDLMLDWLTEEQLIQRADSVELQLYMNYSPLRLTVDGLISVLDNLKDMGKDVKASLKFAQLFQTGEGEEDAEENREGLRVLKNYGVVLDVMKGQDWLLLLQTLTQKASKKKQNSLNAVTRERLSYILLYPQDKEIATEETEVNDAEMMTEEVEVREAEVMTEETEVCEAEVMTEPLTPPPEPETDSSSDEGD